MEQHFLKLTRTAHKTSFKKLLTWGKKNRVQCGTYAPSGSILYRKLLERGENSKKKKKKNLFLSCLFMLAKQTRYRFQVKEKRDFFHDPGNLKTIQFSFGCNDRTLAVPMVSRSSSIRFTGPGIDSFTGINSFSVTSTK